MKITPSSIVSSIGFILIIAFSALSSATAQFQNQGQQQQFQQGQQQQFQPGQQQQFPQGQSGGFADQSQQFQQQQGGQGGFNQAQPQQQGGQGGIDHPLPWYNKQVGGQAGYEQEQEVLRQGQLQLLQDYTLSQYRNRLGKKKPAKSGLFKPIALLGVCGIAYVVHKKKKGRVSY